MAYFPGAEVVTRNTDGSVSDPYVIAAKEFSFNSCDDCGGIYATGQQLMHKTSPFHTNHTK